MTGVSSAVKIRAFTVGRRPRHRPASGEWALSVIELIGPQPGPCTAFASGVYGDKPLGSVVLHRLVQELLTRPLRGSVVLIPAANPPAIEAGTRISPDLLLMNRRFPGVPDGSVTDQLAHRVFTILRERSDCIIDVHSGMPTHSVWYTYEYGDVALASAFGLPVVLGNAKDGQLSWAAARSGASAILPEFSGGPLTDPAPGLQGCLNVLRLRGQLADPIQGPATVPVIDTLQTYFPSAGGILCSSALPANVGKPVPPGRLAWIINPSDGRVVDEFHVRTDGAILLLSTITPLPVRAGDLCCMVGVPVREVAPGAA